MIYPWSVRRGTCTPCLLSLLSSLCTTYYIFVSASCTFLVSLLTTMLDRYATHIYSISSLFLRLRLIASSPVFFTPTLPLSLFFHLYFHSIHFDQLHYITLQSTSPVLRTSACAGLSSALPGRLPFEGSPFRVPLSRRRLLGFRLPHIVSGIPTPLAFLGDSGSSSKRAPSGYEYTYSHCQTSRIDRALRGA